MQRSLLKTVYRGVAPFAAPLVAFAVIMLAAKGIPALLRQPVDAAFMSEAETGLSDTTRQQILAAQQAVRTAPQDAKAIFRLCGLYLQGLRENADTRFYERIESLLAHIEQTDPLNPEILFLRGTIAAGKHDFRTARAAAARLVAEHADVARYYGLLADAQVELGEYDNAVATLQAMTDLRPDYSALTRIAYVRELLGDVRGAMEIMETALSDGTATPEHAAWGLAELGRLAFGNYRTQAEMYFTEALRAYPDFAPALAGLARIEMARGNTDKARDYAQRIVNVLPLPEYAALLGDIEFVSGNSAKATLLYGAVAKGFDAIAARGTNVELERAKFLAERGLDTQDNLARARAVYANRPTIFAADTLALALFNAEQYAEAAEYSQKARATGSQDAAILFHAGSIQRALGNVSEARKLFDEARKSNADFSVLGSAKLQAALQEAKRSK